MVEAKCVQKFRNRNGVIIGYRLVDTNNQMRDFKSADVKKYIKLGQLNVVNLTLTSDNRLIDNASVSENDNRATKEKTHTLFYNGIKKEDVDFLQEFVNWHKTEVRPKLQKLSLESLRVVIDNDRH